MIDNLLARNALEAVWLTAVVFALVLLIRLLRTAYQDRQVQWTRPADAPLLRAIADGNWRRMLALGGLVGMFAGLGLIPIWLVRPASTLVLYGLLIGGLGIVVGMCAGEDRHRARLERLVDPPPLERTFSMITKPWWASTTIQINLTLGILAVLTTLLGSATDNGTITVAGLLTALIAGLNVYLRTLTSTPITGTDAAPPAQPFTGDPIIPAGPALDRGADSTRGLGPVLVADDPAIAWVLDGHLVPVPLARRLLGIDLTGREPTAADHAYRHATFGLVLGVIRFDFGPGIGLLTVVVCEGIALVWLPQFAAPGNVQKVFLRLAPAVLAQVAMGSAKH